MFIHPKVRWLFWISEPSTVSSPLWIEEILWGEPTEGFLFQMMGKEPSQDLIQFPYNPGTGIYLPYILVDFYGFHVGKYTSSSHGCYGIWHSRFTVKGEYCTLKGAWVTRRWKNHWLKLQICSRNAEIFFLKDTPSIIWLVVEPTFFFLSFPCAQRLPYALQVEFNCTNASPQIWCGA